MYEETCGLDSSILIEDVSYLRSYDLYIKFSNGIEGIVDMSDSFEIPAALRYAPISEFKKFKFNPHHIWWGDMESSDSMLISVNAMYRMAVDFDTVIKVYREVA
jgi:hypothetical protein